MVGRSVETSTCVGVGTSYAGEPRNNGHDQRTMGENSSLRLLRCPISRTDAELFTLSVSSASLMRPLRTLDARFRVKRLNISVTPGAARNYNLTTHWKQHTRRMLHNKYCSKVAGSTAHAETGGVLVGVTGRPQ